MALLFRVDWSKDLFFLTLEKQARLPDLVRFCEYAIHFSFRFFRHPGAFWGASTTKIVCDDDTT